MSHDADAREAEQIEPVQPASTPFGARPACFSSTLQEVLFVLTASMAIGINSFLYGAVTVISSFVGRDLNMSTAELSWMQGASS